MYTHILVLLIKGCQLLRNFICNVTQCNPFGLVLTYVNEFRRCIVFILDDIMFFLCQWLYKIKFLKLSFWFLSGF